jgi:hypothetical protein
MATENPDDSFELVDVTAYAFTRKVWVDAAPAVVYDLISDVSMIAAWSPDAGDVGYDDGAGPRMGAWFSGRNHRDGRSWTTRSQVVAAEPGSDFGFVVGGADDGIVRWHWSLLPSGAGTEVQQSWQLLRTDPVLGETRADLCRLCDFMIISVESTLVSLTRWISETHARPVPTGTTAGV